MKPGSLKTPRLISITQQMTLVIKAPADEQELRDMLSFIKQARVEKA
jgi:hypothetical protein